MPAESSQSPSAEPGPAAPPIIASTAPQPECPQTVIVLTPSTSTAYSMPAPTDESPVPYAGTMLPTLRRQNRSPGPLGVIRLGPSRESAQVMNSCSGF